MTFRLLFSGVVALLLNVMEVQSVYVDLSISGVSTVVPYVSENVTLSCTVTQRTQNRYYRRSSNDDSLVRIRILKSSSGGYGTSWKTLAQMSDTDSSAFTFNQLTEDEFTASGNVVTDTSGYSNLKMTWPKATLSAIGTFVCEAIIVVSDSSAKLTRSSQLNIGDALKGKDIARIFEAQKTEVVTMVEKENKAVNDQLQEISENVKEMLVAQNQKLAKMESRLQGVLESGFLLYWPVGSVALLEPMAGCPLDATWTWEKGSVRIHSESTQRNKDEVSKPNNLKSPVLSRDEGNNFVTLNLCTKKPRNTVGPVWPRGSYCFNKVDVCPEGFEEGFVVFNGEDQNPETNCSGALPDVKCTATEVKLSFCCRDDGSPEELIYLPSNQPFYLYRIGGRCQSVYGMNVTSEFLAIDTENDGNSDRTGSTMVPDLQLNNVRLELCYYHTAL